MLAPWDGQACRAGPGPRARWGLRLAARKGELGIELTDLYKHLRRGGAATLNHPASYAVAEGAVVAPARYAGRQGSVFVFETRFVDGAFRRTVLIDSNP